MLTKQSMIPSYYYHKGTLPLAKTVFQGHQQLIILPFLRVQEGCFYVIDRPLMKKLLRHSVLFTVRMEFPLVMKDAPRPQKQEAGAQIDGPDQDDLPSSLLTSCKPSPSPGSKSNFHISNSCLGTLIRVFIE